MNTTIKFGIPDGFAYFLATIRYQMLPIQEQQMIEEIMSFPCMSDTLDAFCWLNTMSCAELSDILQVLRAHKAGMTTIDPQLRMRAIEILRKYNYSV